MSKFKVGDRVRYVGLDVNYPEPENNGRTGTVVRTTHGGFDVDWDSGTEYPFAVLPDNLEPCADPVNSPAHYASGDIECIDAIKAQMSAEQFKGYLRGNIAKYVWRYEAKGGSESLEKARWYVDRLIGEVRNG